MDFVDVFVISSHLCAVAGLRAWLSNTFGAADTTKDFRLPHVPEELEFHMSDYHPRKEF